MVCEADPPTNESRANYDFEMENMTQKHKVMQTVQCSGRMNALRIGHREWKLQFVDPQCAV
jgi:hypothetical protein